MLGQRKNLPKNCSASGGVAQRALSIYITVIQKQWTYTAITLSYTDLETTDGDPNSLPLEDWIVSIRPGKDCLSSASKHSGSYNDHHVS